MIGDNIRKIREESNLSLTELASKIGISRPYLSLIESNHRTNIKAELLNKIADTLNVPSSMLTGNTVEVDIPIEYLIIAKKAFENDLEFEEVQFALDFLIEAKKRYGKDKKGRSTE